MRRLIVPLLLLILVGGPVAFAVAALERAPALPASAALTPQQAAQSRALVSRARALARDSEGEAEFAATRAELDGLAATAARAFPSLRGRNRIDADGLETRLSFQPPLVPQLGWINLTVSVAPSAQGLDVRAVRLGRMNLPPSLTVRVVAGALDLATTENLGTVLLASVSRVRTSPDRLRVTVDSGGRGDASLFSRVTRGVRDAAGLGGGAAAAHYAAMTDAARAGELPRSGSAAPWLHFALARAAADGDPVGALPDALVALAAHCGDRRAVESVAGPLSDDRAASACAGTALGGRDDLRKHFILSAAFQATASTGVSFALGEVKELVDAGRRAGSGFSFDDIAADRAGIRWAEAAARAARDGTLGALAEASGREAALMPSTEGLASFLPEAEFVRRYGTVDSAAYVAEIARIDARIDALPLHAD